MEKDFYKILGLVEQSSADEIKKAYRKLAKKYHPDATGGDRTKEEKFKQITEAYETLSDEKKRKDYDMTRKAPFPPRDDLGFGGRPGAAGSRVSFDFQDLFGANNPFDTTSDPGSWRSSRKGSDVQTKMALAFAEAALGCEKTLILEPQSGGGRRITIRVPAGVEENEIIRVPGQGRAPTSGNNPGDLLVQVHILPHPSLQRSGADLTTEVPVRVHEAILGGKASIQGLEGPIQLSIPAGTSSGQKLRVRGKGAGNRRGGRGDLYATVRIVVPKNVSPEAAEHLQKFADLVSYD